MVNAIRPWEEEYKAHLTNFVSSPHFASARFYVIRRIAGKRSDRIDHERLFFYTISGNQYRRGAPLLAEW